MGITKTQRRGLPVGRFTVHAGGQAATARQEDVWVRPVEPVEHAPSMALGAALVKPVANIKAANLQAEVEALRERVADLETELAAEQRARVAMEADTRTAVAEAVAETEHRMLGTMRKTVAGRKLPSIFTG